MYLLVGKINTYENVKQGAICETFEVRWLQVEIISFFYLKHYEGIDDKIEFYFVAKLIGGALRTIAGKDSIKANWFTLEEIEAMTLRDDKLFLIQTYINIPNTLSELNYIITT